MTATRAPATLRAYRSDLADFASWCEGLGAESLPAAVAVLGAYLSELAQPGDGRPPAAVSTIERRLSAVVQAHRLAGFGSPRREPLVAETIRGLRRLLGVAPKSRKTGALTADVKTVAGAIDLETLVGLRDPAVLLVGYAAGLRRSELVALDVADAVDASEGLVLRLRGSKTDQERAGREVPVVYCAYPACCPARALRTWMEAAEIFEDPVFRPVNRDGAVLPRQLTAQSVALIAKARMAALGDPAGEFAGHSLPRGHATSAARGGAPERVIMATAGRRSTRTVRGYIEDGELFDHPGCEAALVAAAQHHPFPSVSRLAPESDEAELQRARSVSWPTGLAAALLSP